MTDTDIIRIRLDNQQLSATNLQTPAEVVHWMGAMQAQEYAMAKWAIALRLKNVTESTIEKEFNDGAILRTHVMRPTWHFVAPEDIRWLLMLTAPRVHAANAYMARQVEIDKKLLTRTNNIIAKALEGGKFLTRTALEKILLKNKIKIDGPKPGQKGIRLAYIMMYAELEQLICSGPREGKQFTYALIDERVPAVKKISREEALAKFAQRYFTSRGPVTVQDFAYWSGLTVKDAIAGAASLDSKFIRETVNGQEYIFLPPSNKKKITLDTSFLMPDYDEYGMSYKDRSILKSKKLQGHKASIVFNRMVVINGLIEGTWQRTMSKNKVDVEIVPFTTLSKSQKTTVASSVKRFQSFADLGSGKKSSRKK
ncbi:MAG TPA: winged helix DNA-binding domain-containing protein [Cyclobacteriaceae bacterium]|nr:winged helix DNA-binding domain-containing protein [Cyclobacteriaceae bacterium]